MTKLREFDLRLPIARWLVSEGYFVFLESGVMRQCDMVGVKFAGRVGRKIPEIKHIICVELKLVDMGGVITQCKQHRESAHIIFAAMPCERISKMRRYDPFVKEGVGLLRISGEKVDVVVPSGYHPVSLPRLKRLQKPFWRRRLVGAGRMGNPRMLRGL